MTTPCPHPDLCGVSSHREGSASLAACRARGGARRFASTSTPLAPDELPALESQMIAGLSRAEGTTFGLVTYLNTNPLNGERMSVSYADLSDHVDDCTAALAIHIGGANGYLAVRERPERVHDRYELTTYAETATGVVEVDRLRRTSGSYVNGRGCSNDFLASLAYAAHPGRTDFESARPGDEPAQLSDDARHLARMLVADADIEPFADLADGRRERAVQLLIGGNEWNRLYESGSEDGEFPEEGDDPVAHRAAMIPWAHGYQDNY